MINPFIKIKDNSRWTYKGQTIIVQETNSKGVAFYYLNEWWKQQPLKVHLYYMSRFEFIMKVQKYKYR